MYVSAGGMYVCVGPMYVPPSPPTPKKNHFFLFFKGHILPKKVPPRYSAFFFFFFFCTFSIPVVTQVLQLSSRFYFFSHDGLECVQVSTVTISSLTADIMSGPDSVASGGPSLGVLAFLLFGSLYPGTCRPNLYQTMPSPKLTMGCLLVLTHQIHAPLLT